MAKKKKAAVKPKRKKKLPGAAFTKGTCAFTTAACPKKK